MFLKVSSAHNGCIYLTKYTVTIIIFRNITTIQNNCFLCEYFCGNTLSYTFNFLGFTEEEKVLQNSNYLKRKSSVTL